MPFDLVGICIFAFVVPNAVLIGLSPNLIAAHDPPVGSLESLGQGRSFSSFHSELIGALRVETFVPFSCVQMKWSEV